jgi:hypothetical protein
MTNGIVVVAWMAARQSVVNASVDAPVDQGF